MTVSPRQAEVEKLVVSSPGAQDQSLRHVLLCSRSADGPPETHAEFSTGWIAFLHHQKETQDVHAAGNVALPDMSAYASLHQSNPE